MTEFLEAWRRKFEYKVNYKVAESINQLNWLITVFVYVVNSFPEIPVIIFWDDIVTGKQL